MSKIWIPFRKRQNMPKSVPLLMLDKVRLMCSDLRYSTPIIMSDIKVPNKSLSHELNKDVSQDKH